MAVKTFNVVKNPPGLSYGNLSRRIFARYAIIASEYEWVYGTTPRNEFPPHRALDGTRYSGPDDEALACFGSWPPVSHYYPGDHSGCGCGSIPFLLDSDGQGLFLPG